MLRDFLRNSIFNRVFCDVFSSDDFESDDARGAKGQPCRYKSLKRSLLALMLIVSLLPLSAIAVISHLEAGKAIREQSLTPLKTLVNKTRHSFELYLAERRSAVSFIASAYSFEQLADQNNLEQIFRIMSREFGGFVDLGLIDADGVQVSYAGPYALAGKEYGEHGWFQEVMVMGHHVSEVFLGYRSFPHFVIAVEHDEDAGRAWALRATINTSTFDNIIDSMRLDPDSDAFIVSRVGVLQTDSRFYGRILQPFPLPLPRPRGEAETIQVLDKNGREMLFVTAAIEDTPFDLVLATPRSAALKAWDDLRGKMLAVFVVSVLLVVLGVNTLSTRMVRRIELSDRRREAMLHNMEHSNKLASIGRLAAGVAHEINNPLAIINEKAGLMEDLVGAMPEMPRKDKFMALTRSIIQSVERCSNITHRLLGFARRMDVRLEKVDVNAVLGEVAGFLEKEALYRNIELSMDLDAELPSIESDHGQLQQVFLPILNHALNAVSDGGHVAMLTRRQDDAVAVSIVDDGHGMTEEVRRRIFEPFFSTKGTQGTGLGLSITSGLVQKLGGRIEIDTEPGRGTRFTVLLPLQPPPGGAL